MNRPAGVNFNSHATKCPVSTPKLDASISTATCAYLRSNWRRKIIIALVFCVSYSLVEVHSAAPQNVPTATIELSGGSVAAGVGYTWGSGTLIFDGKKYPLKIDGISIVHVGASQYTASGTVYNLKNLRDINGVYTAVSAGAAIAGGASATAMKNSHGVLIQMVSTHAGLNFSLGPKGVRITLANHAA
ncbi:MAG TPA: hypothetical protein VJ728_17440 [Candidatus Binataceae bacterium]|nr:hypothetical protein [Candidatus Binataceae bacterium]